MDSLCSPREWLLLAVGLIGSATIGTPAQAEERPGAATAVDPRLTVRTLNDAYHPWSPPDTRAAWESEKAHIQRQLLVATGLWPLPEKTPLEPVVHGRVERDGFTVERVYFASRPGLYLTGSLYRPTGTTAGNKHPGVLCPHGHWPNGRFYDAGEAEAQAQVNQGAESSLVTARSPLQARMVQLARMGCVVFHYDMIGYADHGPLAHNSGFNDAQAELWSQNLMGLQTWNSIRALDFLLSLPDVDPERIGVTGASGGGTQTFVLAAIDDRPDVLFPAVMVSTAMQGGCVCENASYLRTGLNNVAFAACAAPRPMALSGADDWTIDIESKGLPELQQVYGLYEHPELVHAKCYPQFGHNYNKVSRTMMYEWFNEHLGLGHSLPIEEQEFLPLTREELTVFATEHPRPEDALTAEQLRARLTEETLQWQDSLVASRQNDPEEYRRIVGGAAEVMFGAVPDAVDLQAENLSELDGGVTGTTVRCWRRDSAESVPGILLRPAEATGAVTVWVDEAGSGSLFSSPGHPRPEVAALLAAGETVLSGDVFLTGSTAPAESPAAGVNETFAGYTFGYNRPLIANRVRDVLTLLAAARQVAAGQRVRVFGSRGAGVWVALARSVNHDEAVSFHADLQEFDFTQVHDLQDPRLLPAALKFGDLPGLIAAGADGDLQLSGLTPATAISLQELGVPFTPLEHPLLPVP